MAAGPRKTKAAAPAGGAPQGAPVAEPAPQVSEQVTEAVESAQEAAQHAVTPATEAVKSFEPVKPEAVVAEVKRVQEAAKEAAAETAHAMEDSFTAASKSLQVFSAKAMEAYQANANASVSYLQALSGVRSVSEAIALQSDHMRKQYETLTAQAKELTALAQQVAADAAGPFKDQIGKALKPK